jgi:hypothetical protein
LALCNRLLTHSLAYLLTHSLTHSLTDGRRRYLDMFVARLGFLTYIIFGALNIHSPTILYSFIPLFLPNVLCYRYSPSLTYSLTHLTTYSLTHRYALIKWDLDSEYWCYYHAGFHLFTAIEQFLILYYYVIERDAQ